jgi:hypothetical protein
MTAHPSNFEVPDASKVPIYITAHFATHSEREFFIDLATLIPFEKSINEGVNRVMFRFSMSKPQVQELIINLKNQLDDFDSKEKPPQPPPLGKVRFK